MKYKLVYIAFLLLTCGACQMKESPKTYNYSSKQLEMVFLSERVYLHTSYITLNNGQVFPCNGLVYLSDGEAIVFDTPTNEEATEELLAWLEQESKVKVKALVVNHFHNDCLGGIQAFHRRGIPSYAQEKCISLAKADSMEAPQQGFEQELVLSLGSHATHTRFFGPGHSPDNVVTYLPDEEVLFGGCLVKSLGAGKGNLSDADTLAWAKTVKQVKRAYPNLKTVVPGHGEVGDSSLLDYTIQMFSDEKSKP
ncbi:MAG: subclass B1 metallo-beta-lactamase [Bacteroidetes bacterium]|nr:MAG: subclass B1 metallo-beta-lactamase [Bacteroidota bacterium]